MVIGFWSIMTLLPMYKSFMVALKRRANRTYFLYGGDIYENYFETDGGRIGT